jgi:RHS repeat-associated protein
LAPAGSGSGTTISVAYDGLGNITSKSGIGAHTYGPGQTCANTFAGPHAVSSVAGTKNASYCYDNNCNLTQGDSRTVGWTAFNMPALIQQNLRQIALTYGPDRARFKRVDTNETGTTVTYYVAGGSHEVVESGTTVKHKTYIGGVAVVIETTSTPTASETIYLLHDHLGSTDVITDATGAVQTRYSFDAWGRRRDVTWAAFITVPATIWQNGKITRGFTGHEQLDEVGLVHMNGRVYDPELGRFLSADPFVQDPSNLQSLNPYSYVQNNPLSYTDPTGHFLSGLFKAIGHFFSSVFRAVENAVKAILKSSIFRAIIQIAACAFGGPIGCVAAAGGLSLAAGGTPLQALEAMAFAGISIAVWTNVGDMLQNAMDMTKVLVHGVVNGALRMAQGGNFLNGFAIGAAGEGADVGMKDAGLTSVAGDEGKFLRASIAGVAGGTASVLTGGKFANGAVSAAFAHLFNDDGPGHRGIGDNGGPPLGSWEEPNYESTQENVLERLALRLATLGGLLPAIPLILSTQPAGSPLDGSPINLVNGWVEAVGSPFRFQEDYYDKLWDTGRGSPFLIAQEVLATATTSVPDGAPGFIQYTNDFWEMVYNPQTGAVRHLQPIR